MSDDKLSKASVWYKEFWGWVVFGPLLFVIFFCIIIVTMSFRLSDDVVKDDYYKEGRLINHSFAAKNTALAEGINGELNFDLETAEVWFFPEKALPLTDIIQLELSHPAHATLDSVLILQKAGALRYRADLPSELREERWYVRISGYQAENTIQTERSVKTKHDSQNARELWRLIGEINFAEDRSLAIHP